MSNDFGDWYCKACGYICSERVTCNETCDTCHQPVEWHSGEQQDRITELQAENAALIQKLQEAESEKAVGWERHRALREAAQAVVEKYGYLHSAEYDNLEALIQEKGDE